MIAVHSSLFNIYSVAHIVVGAKIKNESERSFKMIVTLLVAQIIVF